MNATIGEQREKLKLFIETLNEEQSDLAIMHLPKAIAALEEPNLLYLLEPFLQIS